jgi:dTDP-4-amino-4,6-dideoxygalactose transaminase
MTSYISLTQPLIGQAERDAVDRVLASGRVTQGPEIESFECEFSRLVDGRHCVAVNSGTSALHLALLAMGVRAGDEIITSSFSFAATGNAVALAGATSVFVDIERASFCLDPTAIEAAITPRTVAILPVHLYGHPAAMDRIVPIARRHGLAIIEDAAQAIGAGLHGIPVGTFGLAACFSFYPTKNMTTLEGGMVVTPDAQFARTLRLLRNQGMQRPYSNEIYGLNNRMTDVNAAVGRIQLTKLARWNETRQRNAKVLDAGIKTVLTPRLASGAVHVYHQFTIRSPQRDALRERLVSRGIGCGVYYPVPIHRLPSFDLTLELPETEKAATEVLSLPVHPSLSGADLERIIAGVNA